jgi:predicted SAM-dependent methyltransferase
MSLKSQMKSYCPGFVIDLMKAIRQSLKQRSSRTRLRKLIDGMGPIKLELGAGNKTGANGWTTLDLALGCDICCNLAKGLPFPDNSVNDIYSSHFFEHLTYAEARTLMDECIRVLKPEGRFSICVPNARLYLEAYFRGDDLSGDGYITYEPALNRTTKIDYVNYVAYMNGQHKYMFDEENLVHLLKARGFRNVRLREFDKDLDLEMRIHESIYAEGFK